jgi:hypothetical protein
MLISQLYSNIYAFTVRAVPALTADKIIFANQSSPRPKKPFIVIALANFKNIGTPIARVMDTSGYQKITTSIVMIASFTAFSDVLHEAEDLLGTLYSAFGTELQNSVFKGELALQRVIKNISALPAMLNEQMESRAILELEIAFNKTVEDNVGLIEQVKVKDMINNSEFVVSKEGE